MEEATGTTPPPRLARSTFLASVKADLAKGSIYGTRASTIVTIFLVKVLMGATTDRELLDCSLS